MLPSLSFGHADIAILKITLSATRAALSGMRHQRSKITIMLRPCMFAFPCALRFCYFFYSTCILSPDEIIIYNYYVVFPTFTVKRGLIEGGMAVLQGGWFWSSINRFYFREDAINLHPTSIQLLPIPPFIDFYRLSMIARRILIIVREGIKN